MTASLALLHLVRATNPPGAFAAFRAAYAGHEAGCAHELVLLLKGFAPEAASAFMAGPAAGMGAQAVVLDDQGQDLLAYRRAAAALAHEFVCCLNSFARPDAPQWLGHLARAAALPGVGIAGATGSWESARLATAAALAGRAWHQRLPREALVAACFPGFPNPAIRTNGFVLRRAELLALVPGWIRGKFSHAMVESGRIGITHRLRRRGLRAVVVDRNGQVFDVPDWPASATFRSGAQAGLMLRDNRTDAWAAADPATQQAQARLAWGNAAV